MRRAARVEADDLGPYVEFDVREDPNDPEADVEVEIVHEDPGFIYRRHGEQLEKLGRYERC